MSNYFLPIFYFLFIFSILVVINYTTRIVFLLLGDASYIEKNKLKIEDKIYFGLAFSLIISFMKFS